MDDISYPVEVSKITRFEKLNPDIFVNVFCYEKEIYPLLITKHHGRKHHVNLLYLTGPNNATHYCLIRSLSRMLSSLTNYKCMSFYWNYCLHRFSSEARLNTHIPYCSEHVAQKVKLPTEANKWMYFQNYTLCHSVPYTIYADFESFIVPTSEGTTHHVPASFCYVIVGWTGRAIKDPVLYRGKDVVDTFLAMLLKDVGSLDRAFNAPITMLEDNDRTFRNATYCRLCKKPLAGDERVRNHSHITGEFLGAAHNVCNINYKVPEHAGIFS
ncbi:MAG: hypothetical protein ACTS5R_02030 [Candidatus Hodgkinia cicadicola]